MELKRLVPGGSEGWVIDGEDALYDKETIFNYMDGAGEVYLSFDFRQLFVRRFIKPGEEGITVELYDMGHPADAFGIFTRGREGEDAGVGQGSEYRSGYMVFWKGRYLATVYTLRESEDSKRAVLKISRAIADNIAETGSIPEIVSLLPSEELIKNSVRYFHKYTDLNQHYFIADDNILDLGMETEAVIANYREADYPSYLLIIKYPDEKHADSAYSSFIEIYLPEAKKSAVVQLEDGLWTAAAHHGVFITAVMDAPSSARAESLLESVEKNIKGEAK